MTVRFLNLFSPNRENLNYFPASVRLILLLAVLFTGCGYHIGQGALPARYETISVPFATGDSHGELTAALIRELTRSGGFRYCKNNAELILCAEILGVTYENIGFRQDLDDDCKLSHSIVPCETRAYVFASVSVIDSCSHCTVLGPVKLRASVDFDHDFYTSPDAINVFSLGQLTEYDSALDVVYQPLYRELARKIVDYINDAW